MATNLRAVIGKLNDTTRNALEASGRPVPFANPLRHRNRALPDEAAGCQRGRISRFILRHFGIDRARLAAELTRSLDKLKSGNARTPAISPSVLKMMTRGLDDRLARLRRRRGPHRLHHSGAGHAWTSSRASSATSARNSRRSKPKRCARISPSIVAESRGRGRQRPPPPRARLKAGSPRRAARPRTSISTPSTSPRTPARARSIRCWAAISKSARWSISSRAGARTIPILMGEAGVGKTAVVEGFALRVAQGDVPPPLQERQPPHARPGAAAGRRGRQGRIRESAEGSDRGSEILAHAHHSVHRRSAHHDRRRRRGRPGRRRQPAEAGAGARRTAHHRRHHLVRIQEILRKGSGAGAPLPGGESRRADREAVRADAARRSSRCSRSITMSAFWTKAWPRR